MGQHMPRWRSRLDKRICTGCLNQYATTRGSRSRYCSRDCYLASKWPLRACDECGKTLTRRQSKQKQHRFCSKACADKALRDDRGKRARERSLLIVIRRDPVERPKPRRQYSYVRPAIRRAVFERDNWRCGECKRKVDKTLKWPHPYCAVVDHIIPVKHWPQGVPGLDDPANLRLTHNTCNARKQAGGGGEQLALIG